MQQTDPPAKVASNDRLGPLPEADVQWVDGKDEWGYDDYNHAYSAEAMTAYAAQQVAAERERCAKLCEAEHVGSSLEATDLVPEDFAYNMALGHAAAAIRGA